MVKRFRLFAKWLWSFVTAPRGWFRSLPEPDPEDRRRLLGLGAAALVGGTAAGLGLTRSAEASEEAHAGPAEGRRWGMAIDLDSCSGCNSCQIACRQENNIPTYGPESKYEAGRIEWMSMLWDDPADEQVMPSLMPFPCQQCHDAPCVKVCPVGATYKDSEGITVQVWDRCIGCRYCMVACPYGRRFFNWEEPKFEGSLAQMLNPDVATRPVGVVEKCTFCSHRIKEVREEARLEDRELVDDDLRHLTACATSCPTHAITFGDLNDPESSVAKLKRSQRVFRLLEHLGTDPNVFYLRRDRQEKP